MEVVLAVFALLLVAMVATGAFVAVRVKRAVRRNLDQHVPRVRRLVEDTALKGKRLTLQGPAGEVVKLRVAVRGSLDSTRRMLEGALAADPSLSEALALCSRLDRHAQALDAELKLLEREPDSGRIEARLPVLRERVERVTHSSDGLRWAAQDRVRKFADDELADLSRQCELEAGALRHWTRPTGAAAEEPKAFPSAPPASSA